LFLLRFSASKWGFSPKRDRINGSLVDPNRLGDGAVAGRRFTPPLPRGIRNKRSGQRREAKAKKLTGMPHQRVSDLGRRLEAPDEYRAPGPAAWYVSRGRHSTSDAHRSRAAFRPRPPAS
jgi:hypothetical protein